MLRPLLLVCQHYPGISVVLRLGPSPGTGPGYGIYPELAVVGIEEGLWRSTYYGRAAELEDIGIRAGIDASQLAVELDRIRAFHTG